jgi:hydroxymethylpyrimidine/phosphomethylpyrimidine kinase
MNTLRSNPVRVLTIAGSDSGGGAGIQADLKTFAALNVYGMSVITAVTAQNTQGVHAIHEVPAGIIAQQLQAALDDIGADAIKIGMVASSAIMNAVADGLRAYEGPVVLDPVMVSTSGQALLLSDSLQSLTQRLFPLATLITPNIPEAEKMTGHAIRDKDDMTHAARLLVDSSGSAVLLKGGHLEGSTCDDLLALRRAHEFSLVWLPGERIATPHTHGTGCTLSAAIAAYLGRGFPLEQAVRHAKAYLDGALRAGASRKIGKGKGPVDHGWATKKSKEIA